MIASSTITMRMRGSELVVYITEWDQLTVEHMPLVPAADVIQACAGQLPSLLTGRALGVESAGTVTRAHGSVRRFLENSC